MPMFSQGNAKVKTNDFEIFLCIVWSRKFHQMEVKYNNRFIANS